MTCMHPQQGSSLTGRDAPGTIPFHTRMQWYCLFSLFRTFSSLMLLLTGAVPLVTQAAPRQVVAQTVVFATVDLDSASTLYHETNSVALEFSLQCTQAHKQVQPRLRRTELTPPVHVQTRNTCVKTLSLTPLTGFTPPRKLCPAFDGDDPLFS